MQLQKFDDFAEISLSTYDLKKINIDYKKAIKALSSKIEEEYNELNSEKVKNSRHKYFNLPNIKSEQYSEYIVDIIGKGKVICGIRHLGLQKDEAFVNILTNFKTSKEELLEIYHSDLSKYFKPFNPKNLRYFSKYKVASNEVRNSYLVQNAAAIKQNIQFDLEKDINLVSPENDNYYAAYKAEYEKFHKANPNFEHIVQYNNLAQMEASREAGLLKELEYRGSKIGLIAAEKEDFLGQPGIYFIEILVNDGWKRKGFAKAMQRKYINEVCKNDEIVWGTIDSNNKASLFTAKANLREEIRFENFIKI